MPAEVLWPENESLYDLFLLRAAIGPAAFGSEKQNDPRDPNACEFPPEWFDGDELWFTDWPEGILVKVIGMDPALGKSKTTGDYCPIILYARTKHAEYVECDMRRQPITARCERFVDMAEEFKPDSAAVEGTLFQELLSIPLHQAAAKLAYKLPLEMVQQGSVSKETRILRLTAPLAKRRIKFKARSPGTTMLVQHLQEWPHGPDDAPDCLEFTRRRAIDILNRRMGGRPPKRLGV